MPRPNRRGPSRRGGSYSQRPTQESRRPSPGRAGNDRSGGRSGSRNGGGGYGGRRPAQGNSQVPIYAALGGVALVLVGVLIFLVTSGGGEPTKPKAEEPKAEENAAEVVNVDGEGPRVLRPFTSAEKEKIRTLVEKLNRNYDRAYELKNEGFEAHDKQDYDTAQRAWREARELLFPMIEEFELFFEDYGEDNWDRLERFMPGESRTVHSWEKLLSEFAKYTK